MAHLLLCYNWVNGYKRGHRSSKDEYCSGRPVEVTTFEIIDKIQDMVLSDRWIKVCETVEATGISQGTVFSVSHETLGVKKSRQDGCRGCSEENKRNRVVDSEAILALYRRNPDEFLRRHITVDETWIHHYTPETKEHSKQWIFKGERAPKKAKTVKLAGKVMDTVFCDARGIIYANYLEKGQTTTGAYYASLLHRLSEEIKNVKIMELKFELLQNRPYSPDLAPSDFFISKLEKMARRTTVHVERGGHRSNRCLFWGPSEILLFGRLEKVWEMLGKIYIVKRR